MKIKTLLTVLVLFITGILIAACGGGQNSSGEFNVSVSDDFQFDPSELTVSVGQEITITFSNNASVDHTFNILNADGDLEDLLGGVTQDEEHSDDDEHDDQGEEAEEELSEGDLHENVMLEMHAVEPGDSSSVTFTAPSVPNTYIIFCSIEGHVEAGMHGILIVE